MGEWPRHMSGANASPTGRSQQEWIPPEGLDRSRPRQVRLTGAGIAVLVASAALLIGSIVAFILISNVATRQANEQQLLRADGADTQAVVTRLWRGAGESRQPWVAYTFSAVDHVYEGRAKARLLVWERLSVGDFLPIRFAVSRPDLNVPRGWETNPLPWWLAPLVAAGLAVAAFLAMLPVRNQSRLLQEGRPSPGRVTGHQKADKGTVIHYEFLLLSGATRKGKSGPNKKPLPVDSPVCVIYDKENPKRHALYPLALVRLSR